MSDSTPAKTCTGCKVEKPLSEYGKDRQKADGLTSRCKPCRAVGNRQYAQTEAGRASAKRRTRRYYEANTEAALTAARRWREANPGYSAEANRRWREANPDATARYYAENREQVLERTRAWQAANAERKAEINRAWAQANPDRRSASTRRWQITHPEKAREIAHRRRARKRAATVDEINLGQLWTDCSGFCGICGAEIDPALRYPEPMSKSIDHIVPLSMGGTHEQANLQWAHLVCNIRKGARVP